MANDQLFQSAFEEALPFDAYLGTGTPGQRSRWESYLQQVDISPEQQALLHGFYRKMPVLVLSGIWCGDCARQGPILERIASATKTIQLRFIDNQKNPILRDELLINNGHRVPVVVALSEDFHEIGRFGDRTLSAYRRKARTELGGACDPGLGTIDKTELSLEVADWVNYFERLELLLRLSPRLRERHGD